MTIQLRKTTTNTLIPAKFRGVDIDVVNTRDSIQRAIAVHAYPFTDGADIEDLGQQERHISLTLVWFGADYQLKLARFLAVAAQAGSGELIHPVFGSVMAQYVSGDMTHDADQPEYCELRAEFVEHTLGTPSFDQFTLATQLAVLEQTVEAASVEVRDRYAKTVAAAKPKRLKDYLSAMSNALNRIKNLVRGLKSELVYGLGLSNFFDALSFANDMKLLLKGAVGELLGSLKTISALLGTRAGNAVAVSGASNWRTASTALRAPLLTSTDAAPEPLRVHVQQQQALALALLASGLFEIELHAPSMTPQDIETVANDVRTDVQAAIAATQAAYPQLLDSRPMTEGLKAVAAGVQAAALALIQVRPPFISRFVPANMNLMLLAHHWYADAGRADELLRLNPQIKNPNFVPQGSVVYGYAV